MGKKRTQNMPYYVYMATRANKFLRIYYGQVKESLASLSKTEEIKNKSRILYQTGVMRRSSSCTPNSTYIKFSKFINFCLTFILASNESSGCLQTFDDCREVKYLAACYEASYLRTFYSIYFCIVVHIFHKHCIKKYLPYHSYLMLITDNIH